MTLCLHYFTCGLRTAPYSPILSCPWKGDIEYDPARISTLLRIPNQRQRVCYSRRERKKIAAQENSFLLTRSLTPLCLSNSSRANFLLSALVPLSSMLLMPLRIVLYRLMTRFLCRNCSHSQHPCSKGLLPCLGLRVARFRGTGVKTTYGVEAEHVLVFESPVGGVGPPRQDAKHRHNIERAGGVDMRRERRTVRVELGDFSGAVDDDAMES